MLRKLKITLIFLFFTGELLQAQSFFDARGIKVGLVYEIGQPVHRLGAMLAGYITKEHFQISSSSTLFYAFRNYGPSISRWELQTGVQLGLGYGGYKQNMESPTLLSPTSNFTPFQNYVSYGIKQYWDRIGTQQLCGNINFRFGNYFMASENDGFVFLPFDKYRTGAISIGRYFYTSTKFEAFAEQRVSMDLLLYTGQTQGQASEKITEGSYPSRFGYKKLNNSKYNKSSHGILKLSWQSSLLSGQNAFASVGIDNEHIRNIVQNKFIHDLPFIPPKLIKIKNPHIPMRNAKGGDYLYGENEQVRKGKFVWGVGLNRPLFY